MILLWIILTNKNKTRESFGENLCSLSETTADDDSSSDTSWSMNDPDLNIHLIKIRFYIATVWSILTLTTYGVETWDLNQKVRHRFDDSTINTLYRQYDTVNTDTDHLHDHFWVFLNRSDHSEHPSIWFATWGEEEEGSVGLVSFYVPIKIIDCRLYQQSISMRKGSFF